jgi:hypothetical protein
MNGTAPFASSSAAKSQTVSRDEVRGTVRLSNKRRRRGFDNGA